MKSSKYFTAVCVLFFLTAMFPGKAFGYTGVSRISGNNRYTTAVEISRTGWDSSKNVVLATGKDFPDALCSVPLANLLNAPVLLTESDVLDKDTGVEIERLGVTHVFIIGGYGAVSKDIENKLKDKSILVTRISGSNRFETSVAIANYMSANFSRISNEAVVVNGMDFIDAVSISSAASKKRMPIFIASDSYLPESARNYIKDRNINKVYVIGDDSIISNKAVDMLPGIERIEGGGRYQRNTLILSRFQDDLDFSTVYIATGEDFPDALACSALASKTASPVVLVNRVLTDSSKSFVEQKAPLIQHVVAIGGSSAVSDSVQEDIVRSSLAGPGVYAVKPYDEFAEYLMNNLSHINFDSNIQLGLDNISVSQESGPDNITIYLDMDSDNYHNFSSYIASKENYAKSNVELWMKVIGMITSSQYPGKQVKGGLWNVDSFDSRPTAYSTEDVTFNPSTGKWDVLHKILWFSYKDGVFEVNWGN